MDTPETTQGLYFWSRRLPATAISIVFMILVAISIVSIYWFQSIQNKAYEISQANIVSENLTQSIAQQATDTFDEANIILDELIERVSNDHFLTNIEAAQKLLTKRVFTTEQLHGLFFYDKHGRWLLSSFETTPDAANNSDRDYFIFHANNVTLTPRIGRAIISRTTGEWIIPFTRRVNDGDGQFKGVVLATIKMTYFDQFFSKFSIDDNGAIFLALNDGTIIARRPFTENLIGTSLAKSEIFSIYLPLSPADTVMIKSIIDGVDRLFGYRLLQKYPLVVAAANSKDAILNSWRIGTAKMGAMIGTVLLVNTFVGFLLIKQVRHGARIETDLTKSQATLEKLVLQDPLTGLANRRHMEKSLQLEWLRATRNTSPLSLIMLDIDFFKSYNDHYGHIAGDQCITTVGQTAARLIRRPSDLAVRYGGEEFALLLPDTDSTGAYIIAEKIRCGVMDLAIPHQENPAGVVTVSLGVHTCIPDSVDYQLLLAKADSALYSAKRTGRNRTAHT
ncbi:sensor domain-containing diguanylate cyclase [Pseudomonas mandelii]|uniref:sensor domain-containing diguanylate cyclase n=1 Tax=Pseudomonas mandelii TaxID=75612 RepID=UPI002B05B8A6|nr:sensor domain-containing diguanylate cyclase [Pseudomonas mandelii]